MAATELPDRHCKRETTRLDCTGGGRTDAAAARGLVGGRRSPEVSAAAFRFKNYYQTIAFVNALAWIAHREDHHPDLEVGYNRCAGELQHPLGRRAVGKRFHLRGADRQRWFRRRTEFAWEAAASRNVPSKHSMIPTASRVWCWRTMDRSAWWRSASGDAGALRDAQKPAPNRVR